MSVQTMSLEIQSVQIMGVQVLVLVGMCGNVWELVGIGWNWLEFIQIVKILIKQIKHFFLKLK